MADKLTAEHVYTDAEMLAIYREAALRIAQGHQSFIIHGKQFYKPTLKTINEEIERLEKKVPDENGNLAGGIAFGCIRRGGR